MAQHEPRHEKTRLQGLQLGKTQTSPLSYRDWLYIEVIYLSK